MAKPGSSRPSVLTNLQNDVTTLTRTFESLSPDSIAEAIRILKRADRIWLMGFRGSHCLAALATFWLRHLKNKAFLLPSAWMTFAEDVIDVRNGDAVLAIGFRRRPQILRALLTSGHAVGGARIVLVTDLSASSIAKLADIVLRCHSRPSGVFDSYVAAVSLLTYLLAELALEAGADARSRLRSIEDLHDQLDAFERLGRSR
jgi:DNA-binding MurR/RpiR family transcriptional regulator